MDQAETAPERTDQQEIAGFSPLHHWATPDSRVDLKAVKPHACMENIKQTGDYIHCFNGNHGMRIPAGMVLVKKNDKFEIVPVVVQTTPTPKPTKPSLQSKRKRATL